MPMPPLVAQQQAPQAACIQIAEVVLKEDSIGVAMIEIAFSPHTSAILTRAARNFQAIARPKEPKAVLTHSLKQRRD